jgi:putative transposase
VSRMSAAFGITRDAYYKRRYRRRRRGNELAMAIEAVKEIRKLERRTGTRKLHDRISPKLRAKGVRVGRDRLFAALRKERLLVRKKHRGCKTTYVNRGYAVAPNLLKRALITAPNQAQVSDITYITLKQGFAYLFLVTDYFSRKIVGWHLSRDLSHYSALLALEKALSQVSTSQGIIHHSDRGCQYCCHVFLAFLAERGMVPSMTEESHCYENAVAERVNGILKDEFDLDQVFESFADARLAVENAISIYNNHRTHWSLKLKTPAEVYAAAN